MRGAAHARDLARRRRDAHRLAVRLLAALRLRGDLHVRGRHAERRAPCRRAVARSRPAARAARPGGAARADRPGRAGPRRGRSPAPLGDDPGDIAGLAPRRAAAGRRSDPAQRSPNVSSRASTPRALLAELQRERRAIRLRVGGEERYVAADEAGLYRDALGTMPPGGLPEAFLEDVPDALRELVARYARTHGPFTSDDLRARYGVDAGAVLRELERSGDLVRGEIRPGRRRPRLVRRRGPAAPAACLARGPAQGDRARRAAAAWPPSCRPGRASIATPARAPASIGCARSSFRSRASRSRRRSGSATCCRDAQAPTRRAGSTASARAARSCGSARGRSGAPGAWRSTSARTHP